MIKVTTVSMVFKSDILIGKHWDTCKATVLLFHFEFLGIHHEYIYR